MSVLRHPFDATRPALLASEQTIQERVFRVDEELPWRDLGISEHVLFDFWRSGLVYFKADQPVAPSSTPRPNAKKSQQPRS